MSSFEQAKGQWPEEMAKKTFLSSDVP